MNNLDHKPEVILFPNLFSKLWVLSLISGIWGGEILKNPIKLFKPIYETVARIIIFSSFFPLNKPYLVLNFLKLGMGRIWKTSCHLFFFPSPYFFLYIYILFDLSWFIFLSRSSIIYIKHVNSGSLDITVT